MDKLEKARAYDEALEKAKKELNACGSQDCDAARQIFRLFPELKESEDEKIRNEIIKFLELPHPQFVGKRHQEDWITWLEKQGSITKLNEEEENKLAKGVLISCAMSFINYIDAHKYDGKMCVSNGECEDIENSFLNAMWDRLHRYYCKYIEKQVEQKAVDIESMVKAYKQRIVKQDGMENNPLIDMCLASFKHGVENTLSELNGEQILANSAKTCKNEQNDQTNFTEFEEALADVCRGWIGEEIGWKDYIIRNANALLKICQKMWNEVQDAPFEQKPIKMWHDISEVPDEMQELLVEWESPDATWHSVAFYDAETKTFRHLKKPIENVTRWAYVSDILSQSVTKISGKGWSEEDENILNNLIDYFKVDDALQYSEMQVVSWLKSLKDRLKGE